MSKNTLKPDDLRADVLICGAGPSGLAAAIFMRLKGLSVVVTGRADNRHPVGESLAPAAGILVEQLGISEHFKNGPHLPCYGNRSAWGSAAISYTDFINNLYGNGWHIDRRHFDAMLKDRAKELGATIVETNGLFDLATKRAGWQAVFTRGETISAAFLVDATGRNSAVARRLAVERIVSREQVALVTFLNIPNTLADTSSMVETVENGWWYSAALPGRRIVICFFTLPTPDSKGLVQEDKWLEYLRRAPHTFQRLAAGGNYTFAERPRYAEASESRLQKLYGDGWVAVGDAACSYDPLTAHGLTAALTSARDAVEAIAAKCTGSATSFADYEHLTASAFAHSSQGCTSFYRMEQRWPAARYWRRFIS